MTNMLKKVFNWSEIYLSEMTCYKIHTLRKLIFSWCLFLKWQKDLANLYSILSTILMVNTWSTIRIPGRFLWIDLFLLSIYLPTEVITAMYHNVSSVVEFWRWWVLKSKIFGQKQWLYKGNHCILRIWGAPVRHKLGMILGNKVVQKLKFEKKNFLLKMVS